MSSLPALDKDTILILDILVPGMWGSVNGLSPEWSLICLLDPEGHLCSLGSLSADGWKCESFLWKPRILNLKSAPFPFLPPILASGL